jgi:hypothetical protein
MKSIFLTSLLSFTACTCYCQFPITDGFNNQIFHWDSICDIKNKTFFSLERKALIDYYYTVTTDNKIIAEVFRYDDSSYFLIKYDSSGKHEIQSGLVKLCNEVFQNYTLQIPNWNADPDGSKGIMKDTIIADYSYRKHGSWKEVDTIGLSWRGSYTKGLREGLWRAGYNNTNPHFPIDIGDVYDLNFRTIFSCMYLHGKVIDGFQNPVFWPVLKGSWSMDQIFNKGVEVLELKPSSPERCQYNFVDSSHVIVYQFIYDSKRKKSERKQVKTSWRQSEDCIEIKEQGTLNKYKLLKLESKRLILQKLKSASNNLKEN